MAAQGILIFGATGDLAQRMLFPSLYFLDEDGLLPDGLKIVGCSRGRLGDEKFAQQIEKAVRARAPAISEEAWRRFRNRLAHVAVDATMPESIAWLSAPSDSSYCGGNSISGFSPTRPPAYWTSKPVRAQQ